MPYFETAKKRLSEWVFANETRTGLIHDTFGVKNETDLQEFLDRNAHREDIISVVARVCGATPAQIKIIEDRD